MATVTDLAGGGDIPEAEAPTNATPPHEPPWVEFWRGLTEGGISDDGTTLFIGGGFVLLGLILAWFYRRELFVANACLIVCCASFLGVVAATEFYFYSRFILAMIVPSVLLVAASMDLGVRWAATHWDRGLQAGKLGLMLIAFLVLLHWIPLQLQVVPLIHRLQRTPFAPLRETAAALRDARARGAATFGYGFGAEALQYYLRT